MKRQVCRVDATPVASIERNANRSIVGNHPLAVVRYDCGHWEFVRHDAMESIA
jgi:hypothetical protein